MQTIIKATDALISQIKERFEHYELDLPEHGADRPFNIDEITAISHNADPEHKKAYAVLLLVIQLRTLFADLANDHHVKKNKEKYEKAFDNLKAYNAILNSPEKVKLGLRYELAYLMLNYLNQVQENPKLAEIFTKLMSMYSMIERGIAKAAGISPDKLLQDLTTAELAIINQFNANEREQVEAVYNVQLEAVKQHRHHANQCFTDAMKQALSPGRATQEALTTLHDAAQEMSDKVQTLEGIPTIYAKSGPSQWYDVADPHAITVITPLANLTQQAQAAISHIQAKQVQLQAAVKQVEKLQALALKKNKPKAPVVRVEQSQPEGQTEVAALQAELDNLNVRLASLEEELREAETDFDVEKIDRLRAEISSLENEETQFQADKIALEKTNAQKNSENLKLQKHLKKVIAAIDEEVKDNQIIPFDKLVAAILPVKAPTLDLARDTSTFFTEMGLNEEQQAQWTAMITLQQEINQPKGLVSWAASFIYDDDSSEQLKTFKSMLKEKAVARLTPITHAIRTFNRLSRSQSSPKDFQGLIQALKFDVQMEEGRHQTLADLQQQKSELQEQQATLESQLLAAQEKIRLEEERLQRLAEERAQQEQEEQAREERELQEARAKLEAESKKLLAATQHKPQSKNKAKASSVATTPKPATKKKAPTKSSSPTKTPTPLPTTVGAKMASPQTPVSGVSQTKEKPATLAPQAAELTLQQQRRALADQAISGLRTYLDKRKQTYRFPDAISRGFFYLTFCSDKFRPEESKRRHFVEDKLIDELEKFVESGKLGDVGTLIVLARQAFKSRTTRPMPKKNDESKAGSTPVNDPNVEKYEQTMAKVLDDMEALIENYHTHQAPVTAVDHTRRRSVIK